MTTRRGRRGDLGEPRVEPPDDPSVPGRIINRGCHVTPLMLAVRAGDLASVRGLLAAGAPTDPVDRLVDPGDAAYYADGNTALHMACEGGHADIAAALLDAGAAATAVNDAGMTPLLVALSHARGDTVPPIVDLLLPHVTDIELRMKSGKTALCFAVDAGNIACVRALLDRGAEVNTVMAGRWTPLLSAAERGHDAIVELLLARGADPRARTEAGWDVGYLQRPRRR